MRRQNLLQMAAQQRRSRRARAIPFPPPVRGLYAKNRYSSTQPGKAAELINWFGDGNSVEMRPGVVAASSDWAIAGGVKSAWPFLFGTSRRIVGHTSTGFRDTAGNFYAATASYPMGTTISANLLIASTGAPVLRYNASGFSEAGFTSAGGDDFTGIVSHHDRVFLWDRNADQAEFFYGDVGAITGEVVSYPLGRLGNINGTIMMMVPLTVDAGHGVNDVLCIITTTGQAIVYEGLDPSNPLDWRVWGRVQLSPPVHPSAWTQFGPDAFVLTRDGIVSLMTALKIGTAALVNTTSEEVRRRISEEIATNGDRAGWDLVTDPDGTFTLLQIPQPDGSFKQMVWGHEAQSWFEWQADVSAWVEGFSIMLGYASDGAAIDLQKGAEDRSGPITATYASTWFSVSAGDRVTLDCMEISLIGVGDMSISAYALADKLATPRAIEEAQNSADIRSPHPYDDIEQNHDERIELGAYGRSFQVRIEVTGKGITWTDTTLWQK